MKDTNVTSWTCLFRGTTTAAAEDDGTPEDSSRCLSRCCEGGAIVCPRPLSSPALTQREREREREREWRECRSSIGNRVSLSFGSRRRRRKKKKRLFSRDHQSLERKVVDKVVDKVVSSSSSFSRSDFFDARVNVRDDSLFLFVVVFSWGKKNVFFFVFFFCVFFFWSFFCWKK